MLTIRSIDIVSDYKTNRNTLSLRLKTKFRATIIAGDIAILQ